MHNMPYKYILIRSKSDVLYPMPARIFFYNWSHCLYNHYNSFTNCWSNAASYSYFSELSRWIFPSRFWRQ